MAKLLKKYIKSSLIKNTFKNSLASLIMGEIQAKVTRFHLNSCYEKIRAKICDVEKNESFVFY